MELAERWNKVQPGLKRGCERETKVPKQREGDHLKKCLKDRTCEGRRYTRAARRDSTTLATGGEKFKGKNGPKDNEKENAGGTTTQTKVSREERRKLQVAGCIYEQRKGRQMAKGS